jgi:Porin subfamily
MKIKSLLLGSAAALFAVSGAQAADKVDAVVIPEPEAVEYVRVCDAYGTGFFYIPGTETCLRIHGYVRYDIGFGDLNGMRSAEQLPFYAGDDTWNKRARASFRVSTARETDYGTLRTYIETRWQFDTNAAANAVGTGYTNNGEFSINFAYIDLNGLRIGKDESFFTTFTGYGGSVINDTTGGGYGPFDTNLISYTFSSGAFTAGVSLEEGVTSLPLDVDGGGVVDTLSGWGVRNYVPHVVVGAGYDAGIVNLRATFGWDSRNTTMPDVITGLAAAQSYGGWAAKVRADVDITDTISAFAMVMYGENSSGYTTWARRPVTGDNTWSVIGGASVGLTDALTANAQIQWTQGAAAIAAGPYAGAYGAIWAGAFNVNYTVTPGFVVTPEVQFLNTNGNTTWGGVVRAQVSY